MPPPPPAEATAGPAFRVAVYGNAAEYADLVPRAPDLECVFAKPGADPRDGASDLRASFFVLDLDYLGDRLDPVLSALDQPGGGPPVVATTRDPSADAAVHVLKAGARDYFVLPRDAARLSSAIDSARRTWRDHPAASDADPVQPLEIVGRSQSMEAVRAAVEAAARAGDQPVLLRGDPGTGKEHIARALHERSARRDRPFIAMDCAAGGARLERELFGSDGAGGGAGWLERAEGGTMLLDDVADLPLALQDGVLEALEAGSFRRLGGSRDLPLQTRLVAGTERDLERASAEGQFRPLLLERLSALAIDLPQLEARGDDALLLAELFLVRAAERHGGTPRRLSAEARERIRAGPWPGNVRELKETVERAGRRGDPAEIGPDELAPAGPPAAGPVSGRLVIDVPPAGLTFEEYERRIVRYALERHGWNRSRAARELSVSRPRLLRKIEKYGLRPERRPRL